MHQIQQITDKYLLSSLLQKSIRLGLKDATEFTVETLFKIDKNYLMYRMMIIAFEDIGAANMALMRQITAYRWGVRNFKERNIDFLNYFKELGQKLCASPKDRSACDSTYILKKAALYGDLEEITKEPIFKDIWQGWQTLGFQRYNFNEINSNLNNTPDNIQAFIQHANLATKNDNTYLEQFYNTQVDPFFLSTPYLYGSIKCQDNQIEELPLESLPQGFVWSAIDGHTRTGAASLQQLIKEHFKNFNDILRLETHDDIYKVVKMLLFRVEGQTINHKTVYKDGQTIKNLTQKKECQYYFPMLSWNQYIQAGQLLKSLLPQLQVIREKNLNQLLITEAKLRTAKELTPTTPVKNKTSIIN